MPPSQSVQVKADELYERCAKHTPSTTFFQDDLLSFGVVRDVSELAKVCQLLLAEQLLQAFSQDGASCYRTRKRDDAAKLLAMSPDERVIFNQIESTGTTGIWTKTIKARTNLHQTVITKCLKNLESKRLVKPVVSVRFPKRKIYMLHHLSPSEDVTGGLWFSDGELDVDLVETLAQVICRFVEKGSWKMVEHDPEPKHGLEQRQGVSSADIERKKEDVLAAREQKHQYRHEKRSREEELGSDMEEEQPRPQKKRRKDDPYNDISYDNDGMREKDNENENDLFMTDTLQQNSNENINTTVTESEPPPQTQIHKNTPNLSLLPPHISRIIKPTINPRKPHTRFRPKLFPSSSPSTSTAASKHRKSHLVPLPSTSPSFPTASSILAFLQQTQISQVELTASDLRTLLDMLVFDGRLERIGGVSGGSGELTEKGEEILAELDTASEGLGWYKYRTVRALDCDVDGSDEVGGGGGEGFGGGPGNGLSEVPCGRCPVFNMCEVGGPVNAEECVYFDEWLGDVGEGADEDEVEDKDEDKDGDGDESGNGNGNGDRERDEGEGRENGRADGVR